MSDGKNPEGTPYPLDLPENVNEPIEPEVVFEGEGGTIQRLFGWRLKAARRRINKFIESRAFKRDLDPSPIVESIWQLFYLAPRLVRLVLKLMKDRRVPLGLRIKCGLALGYVFSPFDLMAEAFIGPLGLLDDIAVLLIVLDVLLNTVDPAIVEEHWTGSPEVLQFLRSSAGTMKMFLPKPVYRAIMAFFGGGS